MRYFRVKYNDSSYAKNPDEVCSTLAYEGAKARMVAANLTRMGCTVVKLEEASEECGI